MGSTCLGQSDHHDLHLMRVKSVNSKSNQFDSKVSRRGWSIDIYRSIDLQKDLIPAMCQHLGRPGLPFDRLGLIRRNPNSSVLSNLSWIFPYFILKHSKGVFYVFYFLMRYNYRNTKHRNIHTQKKQL